MELKRCTSDRFGNTMYYNDKGELHRLDGPAFEWSNGSKEWWVDGKLHRTDGPAVEQPSGTKHWYQHGVLHRLDGPAIARADGYKEWWVDGIKFTEEEFHKKF